VHSASKLPKYAAYLFDLDGTLVDSAPDIHAALNHTLEHHSLPTVELALTRDFVGMGSKALIERALAHHNIANTNPESMLQLFLDYYAANIAVHSTPFPGTVDTLTALKARGAALAVVTNKYIGLSESVLCDLNLRDFFDCVVGNESTPNPKPAPDPALHACSMLNVSPKQTLFVGDASPDVGCARAAGCPVVVRRDGYNNGVPASELGADHIIDSITELL